MFGKAVSPGWDESQQAGGSLQQTQPLPGSLKPTPPHGEQHFWVGPPTTAPTKVVSTFSCPPGHYLGPKQQCLPYDPTYELKQPFNVWPLLLVGIAAYALLK